MKALRSEPKFSSKIQIKKYKSKNTKQKYKNKNIKNIKHITKQNKKLFYSFIIWGETHKYRVDICQKI